MNVDVAWIAMSFDKEAIERFFAGTQSNVGLLADTEGVFVSTSESNSNLLAIQHSLGYGGGHEITVQLIDPDNSLESRLVIAEGQRVYLAYGHGLDRSKWCRPMSSVLRDATLSVEGSRTITLSLAVTLEEVDDASRLDQYGVQLPKQTTGLYATYEGVSKEIEIGPGSIKYNGSIVKFHDIVMDALYDFLRKVTGTDNIVLAYPDLDKTCKAFTSLAANTKSELEKVLSGFGLSLNRVLEDKKEGRPSTGNDKASGPVIQRNDHSSKEESQSATKKYRAQISCDGYKNPLVAVYTILDAINRESEEYKTEDSMVSYENKIGLVDYWRELSEEYTLFSRDRKFDSQDYCVVVGDTRYIRNYVYYSAASNVVGTLGKYLNSNDASVFGKSYWDKVFEILYGQRTSDDFSFVETSLVRAEYIPTFGFNTTSPVVKSIKLRSSSVFLGLLARLFSKKVRLEEQSSVVELKPEPVVDQEVKNGEEIKVIVDDRSSVNVLENIKRESLQAFRRGVILEINTLPFFELSNLETLNKLVYLEANIQPLLGYYGSQDLTDELITGFYTVTGFKHIISSQEVQSSFQLVRNEE